jgi:membrane protein insertase Oxa1/YidC/SpoIIIJ
MEQQGSEELKKHRKTFAGRIFNYIRRTKRLWIAIFFSLPIFTLIPFINIIAISLSIYLASKQIMLARKYPDKYSGRYFAWVCLISFLFVLVLCASGLVIYYENGPIG